MKYATLINVLSLLTCFYLPPVQAETPPGLPASSGDDPFAIPGAAGVHQTMLANIDLVGTKTEILTFDSLQNIYALSITGQAGLNNDTSFIKVILVDDQQHEYLVYETYPLLVNDMSFAIQAVCKETCILPLISTFSLRIELKDAFIILRELNYADKPVAGDADIVTARQNAKEIEALNTKNLSWVAGETAVSRLSFEEKKRLFLEPVVPNLNGFEYYRGGLFEIPSNTPPQPSASTLVANFNWGNRHGENWLTSVKDQGQCGSCWAFASTGATEAVTNLFFNQHLNLDLAEQDALSCSGAGSCNGGLPGETLDYFTTTGLVGEQCFPYSETDQVCHNKCGVPNELVHIGGRIPFTHPKTEDTLKRMIIEQGPVSGGIGSLLHAMTLIGFETDPDDGRIIWIFKNSWGQNWGSRLLDSAWGEGNAEGGYAYVKLDINNIEWTHSIQLPITSINGHSINCVDKDNDQFCNWGLSVNKPATCPAFCQATKDCDDSNPNASSFDANYNCGSEENPTPTPTEKIFTIYNEGNADLVINAIAPETAAPWLSVLTTTPFTIRPNSSKTVPVQITASAPNGSVRLLVNSNDPDENPYPNGVNIEIRRQSTSLPIAVRPLSLPSLTVQPTGQLTNTASVFYGGIAINNQSPQPQATLNLSDNVAVSGKIAVNAADVGKTADIFVYAEATLPNVDGVFYYMLENGLSIKLWDNQPTNLMAFKANEVLTEIYPVSMYEGKFILPGTLKIYFGYRLPDGTLVSNEQPIDVTIND